MERREFLQKSALVVAGAAAVASGAPYVGEAAPRITGLKNLNDHESETLLTMARQLFPHARLDDVYYVKVVQDLDAEASTTPDTAKLLHEGISNLDGAMSARFLALSSDDQVTALKKLESTPFFQKVRRTELVSLYNNHDVWRRFGYPGASDRMGGYFKRGFNDLKWLPEPPEQASPKPA